LGANYTYAGEFRKDGKIAMPKGAGVRMTVEYELTLYPPQGEKKQTLRLPLETLIWNGAANRPMKEAPWAFTGSRMVRTPEGRPILAADIEKSVAAIMIDENAILNSPMDTAAEANVGESRKGAYYEVNRLLAPKPLTPCWLILEPWDSDQTAFTDKPEK
jgi:hypothetical protein